MTLPQLQDFISRLDTGPFTQVTLRERELLGNRNYAGDIIYVFDFITLMPCFTAKDILGGLNDGDHYFSMSSGHEYEIVRNSIHFYERDMFRWDEDYAKNLIEHQVIQIMIEEIKKDFEVTPRPPPQVSFTFDEESLEKA